MRDAIADDLRGVPGVEVVLFPSPLGGEGLGVRGNILHDFPVNNPVPFDSLVRSCDAALVIAPESDGILESLVKRVEAAGVRLLGPSSEAVRMTADKLALCRHWQSAGVPTPETVPFSERPPFPSPYVVKPRYGCGSAGIRRVEAFSPKGDAFNPKGWERSAQGEDLGTTTTETQRHQSEGLGELARSQPFGLDSKKHDRPIPGASPRAESAQPFGLKQELASAAYAGGESEELLIQRYVPGTAASVAFLIGPAGTVPMPPCFQHVSPEANFRYDGGEVPIPPALAVRAVALGLRAIGSVPGLCGYVGVDLVLGPDPAENSDTAIEINPRLTTSYVGLRALADGNLARTLLAACDGEKPAPVGWKPGRVRFRPDGTWTSGVD
jgi:predicted ATP-grasp superfamily ATP-dependent carboligase